METHLLQPARRRETPGSRTEDIDLSSATVEEPGSGRRTMSSGVIVAFGDRLSRPNRSIRILRDCLALPFRIRVTGVQTLLGSVFRLAIADREWLIVWIIAMVEVMRPFPLDGADGPLHGWQDFVVANG